MDFSFLNYIENTERLPQVDSFSIKITSWK